MQALLISLLQILASILEASFSRKSSSLPEDHARDGDDFFHNDTADNGIPEASPSAKRDVKLQKACQVLELTPPVESIDEVRKQWKKLSRRHHPDRNNGSEESHAKQQEINHAMDYIEGVFEGKNNDAEEEEEVSEEENEAPPPEKRGSYQTPRNHQPNKRQFKEERQREKRRRKKQRRQERWRQQEEHLKRREAMKAQMEEEMRKEQELHDKIVKERRKIERETSRLGDLEQRQASSRLFMDQVQQYRRQEPMSYEKPKHYIMESCTNELVIAMRLGMDDYASRILDDEVILLLKNLAMRPSDYLTIERQAEAAIGHVLLKKLDEDDNTLLHHAVYWEREQMIRSIFRMAQCSGLLEEVFCAKDAHGAIPMDLGWVAKNLEIRAVLKQYESIVRQQQESKRLDLASKRVAKQFWKKVTGEFDIISLLNSCLAYYLSCYCAGFHWVWAWIGVAALQSPDAFHWILVGSGTPTANNDVRLDSFLFYLAFSKATWGVFWACMYLVTTTPAVAFELCLLLAPIFILLGWSHVTPERILEFMNLPLFIWSWTSATFLYKPSVLLEKHLFLKLWSYFPPQIRKRYSLLHTFMLLTVWIVINIAIWASRSRHVSGSKDESTGGDQVL